MPERSAQWHDLPSRSTIIITDGQQPSLVLLRDALIVLHITPKLIRPPLGSGSLVLVVNGGPASIQGLLLTEISSSTDSIHPGATCHDTTQMEIATRDNQQNMGYDSGYRILSGCMLPINQIGSFRIQITESSACHPIEIVIIPRHNFARCCAWHNNLYMD